MNSTTKGKFTILVCNGQTNNEKEKLYLQQSFRLRYEQMILNYNITNTNKEGIDKDEYDNYCDHLLVIDNDTDKVVGVYRLITSEHIKHLNNHFLSEKEFNFDVLKHYSLLETGRAVVDKAYRNGQVISILWRGLINYAVNNKTEYIVGTASFHGNDPSLYKDSFTYIQNKYLTDLDIYALDPWVELSSITHNDIDENVMKSQIPPLVKGYLRLGATIGKGAYIDTWFNSIDIFIILDVNNISPKYLSKFLK